MFKLGETYYTKAGYPARIVATDAKFLYGAKICTICALIDVPVSVNSAGQLVYFYTEDGKLYGSGNHSYNLISDEPNEEEAGLIQQIFDLAEGLDSARDRDQAMLKVIRQLRKK